MLKIQRMITESEIKKAVALFARYASVPKESSKTVSIVTPGAPGAHPAGFPRKTVVRELFGEDFSGRVWVWANQPTNKPTNQPTNQQTD